MQQNHLTHLVIGASGKTGSRVMKKLTQRGFSPRAASRNSEVFFDWRKPQSWPAALTGVDAVYLTYYPDLAVPQAPEDITKFCQIAAEKGVKHITLLSGRGEPAAQKCEEIVKHSGLSWTIVRASWFNQNFSEGMFNEFIVNGTIALPVNGVREPFVDAEDISDVVVVSLISPEHNGQLYEVTGPELLSFADLANQFSQLLGRQVQFVGITTEAFNAELAKHQVEPKTIEMLNYLFTEVLDGRNEHLTDGVQRALGKEPLSFKEFVINNISSFRTTA